MNWKQKKGFTIAEIAFVSLILGVLVALSVYKYSGASLRSTITKMHTSMISIQNAFLLYRTDHNYYPITKRIDKDILEIHDLTSLQKPIQYLSPIPNFPLRGKRSTYFLRDQWLESIYSNYSVYSYNNVQDRKLFAFSSPGWAIYSGGPLTPYSGHNPRLWYDPTNGLRSPGGNWRDSFGSTNF